MSIFNNIINQYNKSSLFTYDSEVEREYTNLEDLYTGNGSDAVYTVEALFINEKSKFGHAPVIVSGGYLVNAPSHLLDTVVAMRSDTDFVSLVNDRKVGFKIYSYTNQYGVRYSVEWVQI